MVNEKEHQWGVYCRQGHSCVGPFDTELEALAAALQMTEMVHGACIYDTIPLFLADAPPSKPSTPPNTGQYL